MKSALTIIMGVNVLMQGFFGVQLTFNTVSILKSFNPGIATFTPPEVNQSIFFGTSLLLSLVLLIYSIYLTIKDNKQGVCWVK